MCLLIHAILTAVQRINKLVKDNQLYEDQLRLFKSTTYTQEYTLPQAKDVANFTESNSNHWPSSVQQSLFPIDDEYHSDPLVANNGVRGRRSSSPKLFGVHNLSGLGDNYVDKTRNNYFKIRSHDRTNDVLLLSTGIMKDRHSNEAKNYYKRGITGDLSVNKQEFTQNPQSYTMTEMAELSDYSNGRRTHQNNLNHFLLVPSDHSIANALPSEKLNKQQERAEFLSTYPRNDQSSDNFYSRALQKTSKSSRPSSDKIVHNDDISDGASFSSRNKRSRDKNARMPAQSSISSDSNLNQSSPNEQSKNSTQLVYFNPQTEMSTVYKVYCWSLQIALIYIRNCCYFWMFNEALYLHLILQMAPKEPSFRCLSVVAYTFPLIIVIVYTVARSIVDGTPIDFLIVPIIDVFKPATSKVIGNLNLTALPSIIEVSNITSEQDRGFQDICWDSGSGFAWIEAILDYPNYVLLAVSLITWRAPLLQYNITNELYNNKID